MNDQRAVLAVASYASRAAAETDFDTLWALPADRGTCDLAAAVVEKGTSGELEITRHRSTADGLPWAIALLGGALTTVDAPVGVAFLASGLVSRADWAGATAILGRFWHDVPRDVLRKMTNLLEAGQAGLVLVAVNHDGDDVAACLSGAISRILSDPLQVDLFADFSRATAER
jgi:hypothetical protein